MLHPAAGAVKGGAAQESTKKVSRIVEAIPPGSVGEVRGHCGLPV